MLSHFVASPCLKKFSKLHFLRQKCSATSWLPLASSCLRTMRQKLSALFQGFPSGGGSLRSKVVRGSFKFDIIFYNRKQATPPLIRRRSAAPSPYLHKILLTKFSSAKIVSRYAASPRGEGYIIAPFQNLPLGGKAILLPHFKTFPLGGRCRAQAKRMRSGYINETHNISFESNRFASREGIRTTQKREVYFAPASI